MKNLGIFIMWLCYVGANLHPGMNMFCIIVFALIFAITTKKELKKSGDYLQIMVMFWTSTIMFGTWIILGINGINIIN